MVAFHCNRISNWMRAAVSITAMGMPFTSCGGDPAEPLSAPVDANSRPVANAGPDHTGTWRDTVWLDGSGSNDADGDPLTYQWTLLAFPNGTGAALSDPAAASPHFIADVPGEFVLELVVDDGTAASAPDTVTITIDPLADLTTPTLTVGAGLQIGTSAHIGTSNHGGITVSISSSDPLRALIAPDNTTPGSASIKVSVPDGVDELAYVVQGLAGATGNATVTLTATGFTEGIGPITVVQPAVVVEGLESSHSSIANDAFTVLIGIPDPAGPGVRELQGMSAANATPLTLTVSSTNNAVGQLSDGVTTGSSISFDLHPTISERAVTFVPQATGVTTVSASIPGFSAAGASVDVSVNVPAVSPFSHTIGAGLQFAGAAHLDGSDHGGVTVHIESSDPSVALIAPDVNTPGSQSIDVIVSDGSELAPYVVQGVQGATGQVNVTASAPGFVSGTRTVTVAQPALTVAGLANTHLLGVDDEFTVLLGLPNLAADGLTSYQGVSAAVAPLVVTLNSTNGPIGHVSAGAVTGVMITLDVTAGAFQTQAAFVTKGKGTTTVSASIPGFVSAGASVDVTVDASGVTPFNRTIGAGLQYGNAASLTRADHGGTTFRIESSDPTVALIAPDVNTPGSTFIDVFVADGDDAVPYVVQGVAGTTGLVTVTASATGFAPGTGIITIVQPAVIILGLSSNAKIGLDDTFTVFLGVPNLAGNGLSAFQGISAASVQPVELTVESSDPAVGDLSAGGPQGGTLTIDLWTGMFQPAFSFRPWATGTTTVSASIPGFLSLTTATSTVTVVP